jgi:cobalamin-dependent methionine synthase I
MDVRLAVECAEALAEMLHKRMRALQSARSERRVYSFAMGSRVLMESNG